MTMLPGEQQQQEEQAPAAAVVQLGSDMEDPSNLSLAEPGERTEEKTALLERDGVQVLRGVWCSADASWVLRLLRRQASSLQELQLWAASREQLLQLQGLPRLRALSVQGYQADLRASPALPGPWRGRLRRLRADLPKETLRDLLSAHGSSREALELRAGTPPSPTGQREDREDDWPVSCSDLPQLLGHLQRLRALRLVRAGCLAHNRPLCPAQLADLRAALPGCAVTCNLCPS